MTENYQPSDRVSTRQTINSQIAITTPRQFTLALIREVADEFGITSAEILGESRLRRIVRAREAAIQKVHLARPHLSYSQLGKLFRRDHSAIMAALNRSGGRKTQSQAWRKAKYGSAAVILP